MGAITSAACLAGPGHPVALGLIRTSHARAGTPCGSRSRRDRTRRRDRQRSPLPDFRLIRRRSRFPGRITNLLAAVRGCTEESSQAWPSPLRLHPRSFLSAASRESLAERGGGRGRPHHSTIGMSGSRASATPRIPFAAARRPGPDHPSVEQLCLDQLQFRPDAPPVDGRGRPQRLIRGSSRPTD